MPPSVNTPSPLSRKRIKNEKEIKKEHRAF
jgi:hypothetical protein